jgi:DNA-binding Lrp family transcriptional regulator
MDNIFLAIDKRYFNSGLKSVEMLIASQVEEFERNGKQCYLTNKQFAEMLGESESTIKRELDKLEALNVISRDTKTIKGNGRANKQRTISVNEIDKWKVHIEPDSNAMVGSNVDNGGFKSSQWKVHNEPIKDNLKEKLKDNYLKEKGADAQSESRSDSKRGLEDLSYEEQESLLRDFDNGKGMRYPSLYQKYSLRGGCLDKNLPQRISTIRKEKAKSIAASNADRIKEQLASNTEKQSTIANNFACSGDELMSHLGEVLSYATDAKPNMTLDDLYWFSEHNGDVFNVNAYEKEYSDCAKDFWKFLSGGMNIESNWDKQYAFI